jgi:hypothetical protein
VVRKDSNTTIGTTPFEQAVPYGKTPIEFLFRKPGFEETSLSLIPESPNAALSVSLVAERQPIAEPEPRPAATKPPRSRPSSSRPKHTPRPVNDEDGVLEPSFR